MYYKQLDSITAEETYVRKNKPYFYLNDLTQKIHTQDLGQNRAPEWTTTDGNDRNHQKTMYSMLYHQHPLNDKSKMK